MIVLARERLAKSGQTNVTFREALAEELPFGAAEFDAIVTRLAFHHFANIQAVLVEFRRMLRPHGRLIVATPERTGPIRQVMQAFSCAKVKETSGSITNGCWLLPNLCGNGIPELSATPRGKAQRAAVGCVRRGGWLAPCGKSAEYRQ